MRNESRQAVRAVFLAAIMVVSVFAAGIAFSGSAAAEVSEFEGASAEDVTANDPDAVGTVTLSGVNKTGDRASIFIFNENSNVSIQNAAITNTGNFDPSNVTVDVDPGNDVNIVIQGNDTPTGDITVDVTVDTSSAVPGETVTYDVTPNLGPERSASFVVQASPTVDTDASSVSPTQTTVDETQEYTVDLTIDNVPNEAATVDISIDGFDILDENGDPVSDATIDYTADDVTDGTASFTTTLNATPESSSISDGPVFVDEIRPEDGNQDIYNDQQTIDTINVQAASTLTVNDNGSAEYETIQNAVNNASSGDTIEVASGTYDESVTIDVEDLTLEGPNAGTAGGSDERGTEASFQLGGDITADNVIIDGFELVPGSTVGSGESRTEITGANTVIANSTINVPDGDAPFRINTGANNSVITQNQFADGDGGNFVLNARQDETQLIEGVEITENTFQDLTGTGTTAIQANGFTNSNISGNVFNNIGEDGIRLAGNVTGTEVTNNVFSNYAQDSDIADGQFSAGAIVAVSLSGTVDITENQFNDAGGDNIYINPIARNDPAALDLGSIADSNTFAQNTVVTDTSVVPDAGQDEVLNANTGEQFTSIQNAVDNASSGDTVRVGPGTFNESVTIGTEGVTLETAESVEPTVIGQSSVAISVESPGVTVSDLTIRNPEGDRGVRATDNATNVKIARNTIEDVGTAGAFTQSRGILVSSLKNGDSASGLEVRNNTVNTIQGTGGNSDQTIGIQILEESNGGGLIENVVVDGNGVTNLLDNRSSQGINFNGNIEGDITNNNISTLNTDRPGEDLGFTQAIALNAGGNAANAPQNVRISGNSISGLDDQTPSTESFRATHIILSSVDDTDSIDIRNNVFIAAASDENYILDRASGDFDLQGALGVNTFEPSVVQVEEGSDRILVPDTGDDVDVVNVDQQTGFDQIQSAVDAANSGDTIEIEAGTYNEEVTIDKPLTLIGAGNSANGTVLNTSSSGSGNGITVDASNLTVRNLRITDYSNGIRLKNTHSNIIFENVDSVGNSNRGMEIRNSADLDGLELNNVNFSGNSGDGLRASTDSSIDGLTITNSSFNNNLGADQSGIEIYQSESNPGLLNDVVIRDSEFVDNGQKGIYTEKLSNATIENVTIDGVNNDTNGFNTGIDINLKYDDYENITIRDSTVANVSEGSPSDPSFSTAIAVKARDDPSSYNDNPATLDDVTVDNVTIEDSFNGLRVGEPGVDYSSAPQGPTDVTITDSTFQNNSGYHVEDVPGNLNLSDVLNNQTNEFDRVVTIEDDAGDITGDSIFGSIQPAVDEASSGDTVSVSSDTYEESVEIRTPNITLESAAGTTNTKIEYDGEDKIPTVDIIASDVTVDGFTIERVGGNQFSQGVAVRATDGVQVSNNVITQSGDASQPVQGILVTDNNGDRSVTTDTVIGGNEISGFDHGIAISTQNTTSGGISGAFIDDNTIQNNVIGIKISDFYDTDEEISATVTGNEISNNEDGVRVLDDDTGPAGTTPDGNANIGGFVVERNNIVDNTNSGITHEASADDNSVDASLNWWGNASGPNADSTNDVEGDGTPGEGLVVQDPFLTTPIENIEVDDVGDTKQFAQDVIAPADQDVTAVGFPGPVPQGYTVGDAFESVEGGAIFEYDRQEGAFDQVNGSEEISALDAFVITQNSNISNEDTRVVIEYANELSVQPSVTIGSGFNLVAAPKLGDSSVVFNSPNEREVIYGTYGFPSDRSETALLRTEEASDRFVQFAFGPGRDNVVTPYGGYLIFSEDSRRIPAAVQGGATADQVINTLELNQTAT